MVLLLVLGLILLGVGVGLLARGWVLSNVRTSETLGQIGAYGFAARALTDETSERTRPLGAVANRVGALVSRGAGAGQSGVQKDLMTAGMYTTDPRTILGYRVLAAVGGTGFWIWYGAAAGWTPAVTILGAVAVGLLCWMLPIMVIRRKGRLRVERIDYELPELIDLLVVTLETGVGFLASLHMVSDRIRGPLGVELRLTLQEQRMGLTTNDALNNMLERCETPGLRTFVRSLLQGESLGVSTGQIMRNLAIEMRKRRRSAAEERAQKAPVKLLFPLVFLIFPAMFLVLLGPVYYSLSKVLGGN